MIMWIIGASGAGKTTLARAVYADAVKTLPGCILVDGDVMRGIWGDDLGYGLEDRRRNSDRYCRFCRYMESQNIGVVAAVASLFESTREWNRRNLANYYEVFLDVPVAELIRRDSKGLYRLALAGEAELPGINQPFERPSAPNEVIDNSGPLSALLGHAPRLAGIVTGAAGPPGS